MCDPISSNSMRSGNPNSGFHKVAVSPCLDTSSQHPNRNQGGLVIASKLNP